MSQQLSSAGSKRGLININSETNKASSARPDLLITCTTRCHAGSGRRAGWAACGGTQCDVNAALTSPQLANRIRKPGRIAIYVSRLPRGSAGDCNLRGASVNWSDLPLTPIPPALARTHSHARARAHSWVLPQPWFISSPLIAYPFPLQHLLLVANLQKLYVVPRMLNADSLILPLVYLVVLDITLWMLVGQSR